MFSHYGNAPNFFPASQSRALVQYVYPIARVLAHTRYKLRVDIDPEHLERLRAIRHSRSILLPNHPTPHDWLSMYLISARLALPFHYMTAHEQFTGTRQFWLPKFGAYSIRRGCWGDISSIAETLRILKCPRSRLVMFAEGRCSFSSRNVFKFKTGAVKIGFNYLKRYGYTRGQDLFLVPVAIRYQYLEPIDDRLEQRLDRLEHHLGITSTGSFCSRLVRLTQDLVTRLESSYGLITPCNDIPWKHRIELLCDGIISLSENVTGLRHVLRMGNMNRACNLRQFLAVHGYHHGIVGKASYNEAYFPTLLVLILESIGALDLSKPLSIPVQADLLHSLERTVYRIPDPVPLGLRQAVIRIGEGVNLAHWFEEFCENKHRVTEHINTRLYKCVERNLTEAGNAVEASDNTNPAAVNGTIQRSVDHVSHG